MPSTSRSSSRAKSLGVNARQRSPSPSPRLDVEAEVGNRWLLVHHTSILVAVLTLVMAAYATGHWVGHSASQCVTPGEKNRFGYRAWYLGADLGGTNFRVQLYMVGAGQLRGKTHHYHATVQHVGDTQHVVQTQCQHVYTLRG